MREIKFRAKDLLSGSWAIGDLHVLCDKPHIHTERTCFPFAGKRAFVDPKTIGQFTGLSDKNGEDIYEGDIIAVRSVEHKEKMIVHEIFYDEREGRFKAGLNGTHNRGDFGCVGLDDAGWVQSKEVIGNIYDNPELLEG